MSLLVALSLKSPTRGVSIKYCIVLYILFNHVTFLHGCTAASRRANFNLASFVQVLPPFHGSSLALPHGIVQYYFIFFL